MPWLRVALIHTVLAMDVAARSGPTRDSVVTAVVAFVAAQANGPERLLAIHTHDGRGRCRGCTTPGTGTPEADWPCSLHFIASQAAAVASLMVTGS